MKLFIIIIILLMGCGSTKSWGDDYNDSIFLCIDCDKNNLDSLP